ncbi:MAG: hypothetical protein WHT29_03935, partial [Bacteroidales bacterium]
TKVSACHTVFYNLANLTPACGPSLSFVRRGEGGEVISYCYHNITPTGLKEFGKFKVRARQCRERFDACEFCPRNL